MSPYQISWQVYKNLILAVIYNPFYNGLQQSCFDINYHSNILVGTGIFTILPYPELSAPAPFTPLSLCLIPTIFIIPTFWVPFWLLINFVELTLDVNKTKNKTLNGKTRVLTLLVKLLDIRLNVKNNSQKAVFNFPRFTDYLMLFLNPTVFKTYSTPR